MKSLIMMRSLTLLSLVLGLQTGCYAPAPAFTGTPPPPEAPLVRPTAEVSQQVKTVEYDNRVTVAIFFDDSQSMEKHLEKMALNMPKFVAELAKIPAIDFHIGYTVSHDRGRYGTIVPPICGPNTSTPGRINFEDSGSLRPLLGPEDKLPKNGRRYVTREDDFQSILSATLNPKSNRSLVKNLINPDPRKPELCPYGAEEEEFFSPMVNLLKNPILQNGPNKGFHRPGALFVAIVISDAKDASGMLPEQVYQQLREATDSSAAKNRLRVFSVVIAPGTRISRDCNPDPAFKKKVTRPGGAIGYELEERVIGEDENPLATLAQLTQDNPQARDQQVLSICSNDYGQKLADFGKQIQAEALPDIEIPLDSPWQITDDPAKRLRVFIGNTELVRGQQWSENAQTTSVVVFGKRVEWEKFKGQKIRVQYTPVVVGDPNTRF